MKTKKPRSHLNGLTTEAKIREIDKVLKKLVKLPSTPEVINYMSGLQLKQASLKTELSKQTGSLEKINFTQLIWII